MRNEMRNKMNNTATKQKCTFDKISNPLKTQTVSTDITNCLSNTSGLNLCTTKVGVVACHRSEKKLEPAQVDITGKISDYTMDLMALVFIMLIPTIPFWQM